MSMEQRAPSQQALGHYGKNQKKVIVSGASASIGHEIATRFGQSGAEVVINYRNDKEGALETLKQIKQDSLNAKALYADFEDFDSIERFANDAMETLQGVDILVNNAAIY